MAALAELLDGRQAEALTGLWRELLTQPAPPPPAPVTAAVCGECGRPLPAPAAAFRAPQ
jgi:hypothetical protein